MKTRSHVQKKVPYQSPSTPVTNPFAPRPFGIQAQTEQAASVQKNSLDTQQGQARGYGINLANIPIHAPGTATPSPIQTKLTIGKPGDKYEQEADSVAEQVVSQINSPAPTQPTQGSTVQREEMPEKKEELAQTKPLSSTIQRVEMPEKKEEELAQTKPMAGTIQRTETPESEEEELAQAKPMAGTIQREEMPEKKEELAQTKPQTGGAVATPNIEASIQQARGSGQPLSDNIRQPMEQAFGSDFGGVRIHTDAQSHQLNTSIQARAFTTGQDIFFRQGEYNPGSRGGQELLAHELTHVVQQNGSTVHRVQRQKTKTGSYRPNIRHDHGFLDDGHGNIDETKRRAPTFSDYTALARWQAKLNAAEALRPDLIDATAAYRHFLFGNGATRTINYERFIANDPSGKRVIQSAVRDIVDLARKHHNQVLQVHPGSIDAQTFNVHTNAIPVGGTTHYPYPATENWQKAIGAHIIWLEASVTANINTANNTRSFKINMTLHMEDMYNFNPGAADIATGTPDADNGRFELTGLGREYLNTAVVVRTVTSPPEAMNTIGSGSSNPQVNAPRVPPVRTPNDGRGTGRR